MERMSTQDAGFYFVEDENSPMHVGSVAVFEGPPPAYGDLGRLLVAKLPRVPRYRQRVRTVPLHLGRPMWIDDEHFEILYHVRHTAVPAPGGEEQLRNLAGRVFAQRLDTAKPLWEMWLVEGLQGGRWAIISKVHHCMIDGVAGWDLAALLLDTAPEPEPLPAGKAWRPRPAPSTAWLIADGLRDAVLEPLQQLARVPTLARNLPTRQEILDFGRGLPTSARRLVSPSARSLNGPTGPHRRWEWTQESLGEVKLIRKAVGGTVNDVVLTAITRGFRDLLAGFAAPTLLALGTRMAFRFPQPLVQTVTTNVPGPRVPLYMLGRQMVEIHPYVPTGNNMRISIGIFSYLDQLNFGINADFDAVPDIGVLRRGIGEGFKELVERATPPAASDNGHATGTRAAKAARPRPVKRPSASRRPAG